MSYLLYKYLLHFIKQEWKIQNFVLQTRGIGVSLTAHNLAEDLKRNEVNPSLTTDNTSNICNAVKETGVSVHIRCVAHT